MKLVRLQEVKADSIVRVEGVDYTVKSNWGSDLVLVKGHVTAYLSQLVTAKGKQHQGPNAQVWVVSEPKAQNLTDSFRAQLQPKKQDLTAQLKQQLAAGKQQQAAGSTTDLKVSALNLKVDKIVQEANDVLLDVQEATHGIQQDVEATTAAFEAFAYQQEAVNEENDYRFESLEDQVSYLEGEVTQLRSAEQNRELQARLNEKLAQKQNTAKGQGGNVSMKNLLSGFKGLFGKVEGQFALSLFGGIAVRKSPFSQEWVTYKEGEGITDVQGNVLKFDVPAFRLPAEAKAIKKGNIVVNASGAYGYVTEVNDGFVKATFPATATQGTVLPVKNPLLGKAFYTTVNVLDFTAGETAGFNPMLLMALSGEGNTSDLLPILLASGGLTGAANAGQFDPMMLLALGGDGGLDDILPLLLLQQGGFAKEGVNPLLFLALGDKGGKGKDLLPLLLATGAAGGQGGAMNPMMLMALAGEGSDMKDILMMQALSGGAGLFGAPAAKVDEVKGTDAE